MSKVTYSKKISEALYKKIKYINYVDITSLFEKDENFEIAICVAYLTLS